MRRKKAGKDLDDTSGPRVRGFRAMRPLRGPAACYHTFFYKTITNAEFIAALLPFRRSRTSVARMRMEQAFSPTQFASI
jgi:hypothetical protein